MHIYLSKTRPHLSQRVVYVGFDVAFFIKNQKNVKRRRCTCMSHYFHMWLWWFGGSVKKKKKKSISHPASASDKSTLSHGGVTYVTIALDYAPGWDLFRSVCGFPALLFPFFILFDLNAAFFIVVWGGGIRGELLQIMPNINLTLPHISRVRGQNHSMLLSSRFNLFFNCGTIYYEPNIWFSDITVIPSQPPLLFLVSFSLKFSVLIKQFDFFMNLLIIFKTKSLSYYVYST